MAHQHCTLGILRISNKKNNHKIIFCYSQLRTPLDIAISPLSFFMDYYPHLLLQNRTQIDTKAMPITCLHLLFQVLKLYFFSILY